MGIKVGDKVRLKKELLGKSDINGAPAFEDEVEVIGVVNGWVQVTPKGHVYISDNLEKVGIDPFESLHKLIEEIIKNAERDIFKERK